MIRTLSILLLTLAVSESAEDKLSVVRVNVTSQGWDFQRPWGKRQPSTKRAIGAVIKTASGPRALVTGDLVQNSTFLEFENPSGGKKVPAAVEFVDYEANLALLKTDEAEFLEGVPQLEVADSKIGDELSIWQLENNGRLLTTKGPMTTAEVTSYPVDGAFLVYRATVQLQSRDSSFTLPVVNGGKLTGILMSYDSQSSNANIISTSVVSHFLKDAADGKYDGFPRGGYGFSAMRDPALRRYAKVPAEAAGSGIYVTDVLKDGPAAQAGLKKGDVLTAVNEFTIDQDGNFPDPAFGKIAAGHLLSTRHYVGDTVKFHILRNGEKQTLEVKLARRDPRDYVSDPYIIDRAPRFYVVGGLILQELSRQYLREFGGGERGGGGRRPPDRLLYYDRYQSDLFKDGPKKVVFLSRVLPTPATVGYEDISAIVVKKINGVELQSLDDVAKALEKPLNGFHEIVFEEDPTKIFLDATEVEKTDKVVQAQYRLPAMRRLQ